MRPARSGRWVWAALIAASGCGAPDAAFHADFSDAVDRTWVGPDYYANRLQDWRVRGGRIESVEGSAEKPMRALHLLTHPLSEASGAVRMTVRTGAIEPGRAHEDTWSGFLVGVGGDHADYRISALAHHWPSTDGGLIVAVDGTGQIVVRDNSVNQGYAGPTPDIPLEAWPLLAPDLAEQSGGPRSDVRLNLEVEAEGEGATYGLTVTLTDGDTGDRVARSIYSGVPAEQLSGNVALVSHRSPRLEGPGYWFEDWTVSGSKVEHHEDRAFGPVMGAMYTLSRGTLKMTAQFGPLGPADEPVARLEVQQDGSWTEVDDATIQPMSATAHFRVDDWAGDDDIPYRVAYDLTVADGGTRRHYFDGLVRRIPSDEDPFVLAAFTGQHISGADGQWNSNHFWWPHPEVVSGVTHQNPDFLFFSGDQVYEGGLEGVVREPAGEAALDYLGHWYRFVWAFRDLTRDRPTVTIPDDHDAYHGNIWGNAGVREPGDHTVQDAGGYRMAPEWVNAMHRTQVAHLPDPVVSEPLDNGITTYHTRIEYGGMSFAVLADRMWKSPPSVVVTEGDVVNGWPQRPGFDAATQADVSGAVLLGEEQEHFLETWANDWSDGAWMKVVLSQTPFVDVATIPEDASSGAVLPGSYIVAPGEYLDGEKLAQDMDSNGWPQTPRDRALRAMRKGFAFHVAGDQHLAHLTRYGIDEWNDAGHALTVPSVANLWPRRWFPPEPGRNPKPWSPRNTGEYLDGFGNRITVLAVANPTQVDFEPHELYQRAPGWGIARFNRDTREIVTEIWPRWVDPSAPGSEPYPGWPITLTQSDQYDRAAVAYLPQIVVSGMGEPVVQVVEEGTGDIAYTVRIQGDRFRPRVFAEGGTYTITVGEPGTDRLRTIRGVTPSADTSATLEVDFPPPGGLPDSASG
jgi:phosphodiesterase/alkaline phosphatase D-like protein